MPLISGHWYIILALIIVLIIFGPGKLPEVGGALGRGIREFRNQSSNLRDELSKATQAPPQTDPVVSASPSQPGDVSAGATATGTGSSTEANS